MSNPASALSSRDAVAVTPSDTSDLQYKGSAVTAKGFYVGVGGDVKVKRASGAVVTYKNMIEGAFYPFQVVRVYSTDTTATDIIAEIE